MTGLHITPVLSRKGKGRGADKKNKTPFFGLPKTGLSVKCLKKYRTLTCIEA
jgi:hypothetical protein